MPTPSFLLLFAFLAIPVAAQDALRPDETITFELKAGEEREFAFRSTVEGELSIWARSEHLDVILEVLEEDGNFEMLDDDSGGGKAAHMYVQTRKSIEFTVIVSSKDGANEDDVGAAHSVRLAVIETPIDEGIRELETRFMNTDMAIRGHIAAGDLTRARELGRATDITAFQESARWPMTISWAIHALGNLARDSLDLERAKAWWEAALAVFERNLPPEHPSILQARGNVALALYKLGDPLEARRLQETVHAAWERTVADDHPDLLTARANLAVMLVALGDRPGARRIQELVLATLERTLPADHPHIQRARTSLGLTLQLLGELARARTLHEKAIAAYERTLPADHADLVIAKSNLAFTVGALGDLQGARKLNEAVLAARERTLPEDHRDVQVARGNLAVDLHRLGESDEARRLQELVLKHYERTLSAGHPSLQDARANLAVTLNGLGELDRARELQEEVIAWYERTLPSDHPRLQTIRGNLGITLVELGDLPGARRLAEQALAVLERTLPDDHPSLQVARTNLAVLLADLGDVAGSRRLKEQVLSALERTLPGDHIDLQTARGNLALTLFALGDRDEAHELAKRAAAGLAISLPPDHPRRLLVESNLAGILLARGQAEEARRILQTLLETCQRTLPEGDQQIARVRGNLAVTLSALGKHDAARRLKEDVLAALESLLPASHPDLLTARSNLAATLAELSADSSENTAPRIEELLRETGRSIERCVTSLSARQIELRVSSARRLLAHVQFAAGARIDGALLLELTERLRGLAARARSLGRQRERSQDESLRALHAETVARRRDARGLLDRLRSDRTAAGPTAATRLAEVVRAQESAEIGLVEALSKRIEARELLRSVTVAEIAESLPANAAAVSFEEFARPVPPWNTDELSDGRAPRKFVAMVAERSGRVTRVDLGPGAPIAGAIERWRASMDGPGDDAEHMVAGGRLRALLLDPVLALLGPEVTRLVVTHSESTHLVPVDALPLEDGRHVGDVLRVHVVGCLERLVRETGSAPNTGGFVAFGAADHDGTAEPMRDTTPSASGTRGVTSGQRTFPDLPFTKDEVVALGKLFEEAFGEKEGVPAPVVFTGRRVDKARIASFAPRARYVHVAAHGWFAPESVPSIRDERSVSGVGFTMVSNFRDDVAGFLPLELCGLALTGANLPRGEDGTHPGLISGIEIADLDLGGVELAVLSACETNLGIIRAGQGIMSLQQALATAGVRYSLTSLWKVPDEATMRLMIRFYAGIWRRGETKIEALWNAKLELRNARDPVTGKPRYGPRDWAGWVLHGNPE